MEAVVVPALFPIEEELAVEPVDALLEAVPLGERPP